MPLSTSTPSIDLPDVSFFGRSFSEYLAFFGLERDILQGRQILDVAAGPSSFALEAKHEVDAEVTAIDPLYARTESALRITQETDFAGMFAQMRRKPELFDTQTFQSIDAAEADRKRAAHLFLEDYYSGTAIGRYVAGRLPELPVDSGSYDLVFCGHLLFTYDNLFDIGFHIASCRELLRAVRAGGEVRIHPIVNRTGEPSSFLDHVIETLANDGHRATTVPVNYSFFRGATETLVIRKTRDR